MAGILANTKSPGMPAFAIPVGETANDLKNEPPPTDPNKTQDQASKFGKAAEMLQKPPASLQVPGQPPKGMASRVLGY